MSDTPYATVAFVDTANRAGYAAVRRFIGPRAENILAKHPGRYVLYVLRRDFKSRVRVCRTEDLVIQEALRVLKESREIAPLKVEILLLLEPELRRRVKQALADDQLLHREVGGNA